MEQDREPEQRRPPPPAEASSLSQILIDMTVAVLIGSCAMVILFGAGVFTWFGCGFVIGLLSRGAKRGFVAAGLSGLAGVNFNLILIPLLNGSESTALMLGVFFCTPYIIACAAVGAVAAVGGAFGGMLVKGR